MTKKATEKTKPEDIRAYSYFVTFNNPRTHGIAGIGASEMNVLSNQDICNLVVQGWCNKPSKQAICTFCISAKGLEHIHGVFSSDNQIRFTTLKNFLGKEAHIEITRGNKAEAEAYINKTGKYEEKGETILAKAQIGEIRDNQGQRTDIQLIRSAIDDGMNWQQVVRLNDRFYDSRMTAMIKNMYFDKRKQETPLKRSVNVHWLVGLPGSGKTGIVFQLAEQYGEDDIFIVSDYQAPFDGYAGEKVIVLDEFRGQMAYSTLLDITEGYRKQIHCRNANALSLWNEVYITTVKTPEQVYAKMIDKEEADSDPIGQLLGRIKQFSYCYKVNRDNGSKTDRDGNPCEFYRCTISGKRYREMNGDITHIKRIAQGEYQMKYKQPGDVIEEKTFK